MKRLRTEFYRRQRNVTDKHKSTVISTITQTCSRMERKETYEKRDNKFNPTETERLNFSERLKKYRK